MRDLYGLDVTICIVQEIGADFNLLSIVWLGRAIKGAGVGIESLKYARQLTPLTPWPDMKC